MQELKEEAVRLGAELSLYVAESMFLLCDDIGSMLRFCLKLWRDIKGDESTPVSPVLERLLRVVHYVYSTNIKPKNGIYQSGGRSTQWDLIMTAWHNFYAGIRALHSLAARLQILSTSCSDGRKLTSIIEEALKKIEEKFRCVKDVSEANGFARESIESRILDIWKPLFDRGYAWTLAVKRDEILCDLSRPLLE